MATWRLPVLGYEAAYIPDREQHVLTWHGTKWEAAHSILTHGRLAASWCEEKGHRFFGAQREAGVFLYRDTERSKAMTYSRYVDLGNNGIYWAILFEVRADESQIISAKKQPTNGS